MEIADGLVCCFLGVLQDFAGFFIGLFQDPVALCFQFFLFIVDLRFQTLQLPFISGDLLLFLFDGAPAGFQICQKILKGFILFGQTGAGIRNDMLWKSEFSGDGKGVTLSRNTDQQMIGGRRVSTSNSQQAFSTPGVERA